MPELERVSQNNQPRVVTTEPPHQRPCLALSNFSLPRFCRNALLQACTGAHHSQIYDEVCACNSVQESCFFTQPHVYMFLSNDSLSSLFDRHPSSLRDTVWRVVKMACCVDKKYFIDQICTIETPGSWKTTVLGDSLEDPFTTPGGGFCILGQRGGTNAKSRHPRTDRTQK